MPIYEYECRKCSHRFERIQKFSDRVVRTCPECKGRVDRLVHAPAIQFKGTGWYVTDYADKGTKESEAGTNGSGDGKKGDGKKDTKEKSDTGAKSKSDTSPKKASKKSD